MHSSKKMQNSNQTLNSTTVILVKYKKSDFYLISELAKYIGINFICLISVTIMLLATFMVHQVYNKIWKPFAAYVLICCLLFFNI